MVHALGNTSPVLEVTSDSSETSQKVQKRVSPSKYWCGTLNNYNQEQLDQLALRFDTSCKLWVIGEEVAPETRTPHLQMYIECHEKVRPSQTFGIPEIHWEKRKGTRAQNIAYCTKDGIFHGNTYMPKPLDLGGPFEKWWQQEILQMITCVPTRKVNWYWEEVGNIGKTGLARFICGQEPRKAIYVGGKASDMKCGIAGFKKSHGYYPETIIVDCPRSHMEYLSYQGIEECMNGIFFSGKYESAMEIYNYPHMIVFANQPPNVEKMSMDRWNVVEID